MDGIKAGRRLWGGGWLGKEEEGWEDYNAYSGERGVGGGWCIYSVVLFIIIHL